MCRAWGLAIFGCLVLGPPLAHGLSSQEPLVPLDSTIDDVAFVSRHWGQLSTYRDLHPSEFEVAKVGLPTGCRIEQVHLLQRHAERFPHPGDELDGLNIERFTEKIREAVKAGKTFHGPLHFLNSWRNVLGGEFLTGTGAMAEIASGVQFWNAYGRTLYNAQSEQLGYHPGDAQKKPLLRGTTQSRIHNSLLNWALGFFGPSYQQTAAFPANWTNYFQTLSIPEDSARPWNNTLASQHCCQNFPKTTVGDKHMWKYIARYSSHISHRLSAHGPAHFKLSVQDTYAMQLLCAYETQYLGVSEFCSLFTRNEWEGFENSLDIRFFYNHGFGNPTARAQGIGYVEELLARLQGKLITKSNTSVNSSLTNNEEFFPLGMKFYADFTHDKMVLGTLTALSIDYFRHLPDLDKYPPEKQRRFKASKLVPFTARLITEVIGCDSEHPKAEKYERVRYYPSQYGYDNGTGAGKHRFVRMRLNGAVLPLSSIRGGACKGRADELCPMDKFFQSQEKAKTRAKYQTACFGDYEVPQDGQDVDGTVPRGASTLI